MSSPEFTLPDFDTIEELFQELPEEVGPDTHPDLWAQIEAEVDIRISSVGKSELRERRRSELGLTSGEKPTKKSAVRGGAVPWHLKGDKSVNGKFGKLGPSQKNRIFQVAEKLASEYPKKSRLILAENDRVKIRRDFAEVIAEDWAEDQPSELEKWGKVPDGTDLPPATLRGADTVKVRPYRWTEAVQRLLVRYFTAQQTEINLRYGDTRTFDADAGRFVPSGSEYTVPASMRWFADYQRQYAAQISGWIREFAGGVRPSGEETEATYSDPYISLITLSASAAPDGRHIGPVDHLVSLRESWEYTYHALRNTLKSAGFESSEWSYDRRLEPHTSKRGGGTNAGYAHEHIILITDGPVSESDLQPVLDTHVSHNPYAKAAAHGHRALEIKPHSDLTNAGRYVADYCSLEAVGLEDRSLEYLLFASAATAANTRTVTRSESAKAAATADKCRQRADSEDSRQTEGHGDSITLKHGRIVCRHCGSFHDIDQYQSLADARMSRFNLGDTEIMLPDGGSWEITDAEAVLADKRDIWRDTRAGGSVGLSPKMTEWVRLIKSGPDPPDPDEAFTAESKRYILRTYESTKWFKETGYRGLTSDMIRKADGILSGLGEYEGETIGWAKPKPPEGWVIDSVTVFGETRKATNGGGVPMVEVTNYAQRFAGLFDPDGRNYCLRCGGWFKGSDIAAHLAEGTGYEKDHRHQIKHREAAAAVIIPESSGARIAEAEECARDHQGTGVCVCGGHRYEALSE